MLLLKALKYEVNLNGPCIMYVYICRDEIQRIKSVNPDITHREAFSAAAKNVWSVLILIYSKQYSL